MKEWPIAEQPSPEEVKAQRLEASSAVQALESTPAEIGKKPARIGKPVPIERVRVVNPAYAAWLEQCAAKREYISLKRAQWRQLIAERDARQAEYNKQIEKIKLEIAEAEAYDLGKPPTKEL